MSLKKCVVHGRSSLSVPAGRPACVRTCRRWCRGRRSRGRSPRGSAASRRTRPGRAGAAALSSARVPSAMIRPSCRIAIRSASCSASSRYCVVSSTVVPCPRELPDRSCQTSMRAWGSSPVVGSSRKITGGFPIRLIAMSRRRRMPPEYVATRREPASVSENRSSRSSATGPGSARCRSSGDEHEVLPPGEDLVDGGELSGEADRLPHLGRLRGDVVPVDGDGPAVGLEQRGQDPHHGRLAGSVGAEQGEDAAPRHAEVDAAEHRVVAVGLREPGDLNGCRCGHEMSLHP